jgi:membrane protein
VEGTVAGMKIERTVSLKEFVRRVWREMDTDNVLGLASQMSYCFSLACFPFLIFVAAFVGTLPFTDLWTKLLSWIVLYLPPASQHFVFNIVIGVTHDHTRFLSLGLLGTAWASCVGILNAMSSLNVAYEVKENRSFFMRLGLAFLMLFVFALLFLVSFALLTAGDWVDNWITERMNYSIPLLSLWHVGRWVLSLSLLAIAISLVYYALPDLDRSRHLIAPGTLFVTVAWVPATLGFNFYVRHLASYDRMYGALGAFVIVMVWVYLGSLILLIGAEINCELHRIRIEAAHSPSDLRGNATDGIPQSFAERVTRPNEPQA